MTQKSQSVQFSERAESYDRLQPVRLEMYNFYHTLALDFMPFETQDKFRMLDLGCGTATFLNGVLLQYPNATCVALDYSDEMLKFAAQKTDKNADRVSFRQRDLNEDLPEDLGAFQMVASFSAIHHLTDKNKARIFKQIHDALETDGWFFLIDAMTTHFDNDVFALGQKRSRRRRQERLKSAGIDTEEENQVREFVAQVSDDSPEKDRLSRFDLQKDWLVQAGFQSVDYIWHFWMEHFIICRK